MSVLARFDKEKAPDFSDARFSHQGFYDGSNGKEACCGIHPDS
jgi:hypothetical protein